MNKNTEQNIFDGAKFGDKFVTRDGNIALYIRNGYRHSLYSKGGWHDCLDDGTYKGIYGDVPDADIVSRYQEPVEEEYDIIPEIDANEEELEKFATEYSNSLMSDKEENHDFGIVDIENAFKDGYRFKLYNHRAKEE